MKKYLEWITAVGGLLTILTLNIAAITDWGYWVGGLLALVFGVWSALK
jgi:hypothetical protein